MRPHITTAKARKSVKKNLIDTFSRSSGKSRPCSSTRNAEELRSWAQEGRIRSQAKHHTSESYSEVSLKFN